MIDTSIKGFTIKEIMSICEGELYNPELQTNDVFEFFEVSTAQLLVENKKNNVFILISKERWNEGQFNKTAWKDRTTEAIEQSEKISLIITEKPIEELKNKVLQFIVSDSLEAMRILARVARKKMTNPIVAVTGTVGKSTMTQMLYHIAYSWDKKILKTRGNENSNRDVSLCAINLSKNPDLAVMELSVNALGYNNGEVVNDLKPTMAIYTSGGVGQMLWRSNMMETVKVKTKIFQGLAENGIAIINYDMDEFDFIKNQALQKTRNILTYSISGNPGANIRVKNIDFQKDNTVVNIEWDGENLSYEIDFQRDDTVVNLEWKGKTLSYDLKVPSLGMVETSLGCLLAADALGIPFDQFQERIKTFEPTRKVMEEKKTTTPAGEIINILDDTHNAVVPSMINLINVFGDKKKFYRGKKILVLGQVNDLGSLAVKYHKEFVPYIVNANPDYVFFYGYLMQETMLEMPKNIKCAWFDKLDDLVDAIHKVADDDCFIAMKGSATGSDFHKISEKLPKKFQKNSLVNDVDIKFPTLTNKILVDLQNPDWEKLKYVRYGHTGLSHLLVIYVTLIKIASKAVKLTDIVKVPEVAAKEKGNARAIGLEEGEEITLNKLLKCAIYFNAPDAILTLAYHIFDGKNPTAEIRRIGFALGINDFAMKNITGRAVPQNVQRYSASDLVKLILAFSKLPKNVLSLLQSHPIEHHGELLVPVSKLQEKGFITGGLFWGTNHSEGVALVKRNKKQYAAIVTQADNHFSRDLAIMNVIDNQNEKINPTVYLLKSDEINILGDTYFGETYTEMRRQFGHHDALMNYGYDYSFQKISPFFSKDAFNIFNFKATFAEQGRISTLLGIKGFLAKAEATQTLRELLKNKVSAVTLATNNAVDYGAECLANTKHAFNYNGVFTIGAGENENEAYKPLVLKYNNMEMAIYNGFWYSSQYYNDLDFYALGEQAGIACLTGRMIDDIKQFRKENPKTKIMVIAHWGQPLKETSIEQQNIAHKLIDCGADLIIGHGAHMMQSCETYNGKQIIYGIGNGVFNDDGDYDEFNQLPYSFIVRLSLNENKIKLYPIHCNNLENFWQPYFVTEEQMNEVVARQKEWGSTLNNYSKDHIGYYFELPLFETVSVG